MLVDERLDASGAMHRMTLRRDGDALVLEEDGELLGRLPAVAVRMVMQRYARELDDGVVMEELDEASVDLGEPGEPAGADGRGADRLRRMRYRAAVDAIGRDYLVRERAGLPPVAALSITVTAALRHLAAATRR